ncbi:MAG: nuclear transport factor 2 family protein, partial [Gammaproteobacteria bacterium]
LMNRTVMQNLARTAFAMIGTIAWAQAAEIATPQTDQQRQNLEVVRHWEATYNEGPADVFIKESYAQDADVYFTGASAHGHQQFIKLETAILAAAPGRKMRIDRILFSGDDIVIVEAVILDTARPEFFSPWVALLTIRDGKIVQDRTYLEPVRWPGIEAAAGIPTPGGLGAVIPPEKS